MRLCGQYYNIYGWSGRIIDDLNIHPDFSDEVLLMKLSDGALQSNGKCVSLRYGFLVSLDVVLKVGIFLS